MGLVVFNKSNDSQPYTVIFMESLSKQILNNNAFRGTKKSLSCLWIPKYFFLIEGFHRWRTSGTLKLNIFHICFYWLPKLGILVLDNFFLLLECYKLLKSYVYFFSVVFCTLHKYAYDLLASENKDLFHFFLYLKCATRNIFSISNR